MKANSDEIDRAESVMYKIKISLGTTCFTLHVDLELKDFVISFRSSGCSTGAIPGKRAANHAIVNRLTSGFCRSSCCANICSFALF
jgi:hypothetical protein